MKQTLAHFSVWILVGARLNKLREADVTVTDSTGGATLNPTLLNDGVVAAYNNPGATSSNYLYTNNGGAPSS